MYERTFYNYKFEVNIFNFEKIEPKIHDFDLGVSFIENY
jgi:hypothetical protein